MPSMRIDWPAIAVALLLGAATFPALAQEVRVLVQSSPLAGFRYYAGEILWDEMKVGDELSLIREPGNPHDPHAIRIEWRGRKLGYLPRAENRAVAIEMDRGARIVARIAALTRERNPWQRIRVDVYLAL